jgi:hypothetical protein
MHCDVRIGAKGSPPLFPEFEGLCVNAELAGFGILEGGMDSGKCSTGIFVRLEDGKIAVVELSAALFVAMAGAVKGAQQRFGDPDD